MTLDDFIDDTPWQDTSGALSEETMPDQIEGVVLRRLISNGDDRGDLTVLFSAPPVAGVLPPHVYWVSAAPKSVRAWVYHKRQDDRLAFTNGQIRVVLYDLRPGSPTHGKLNVIDAGADNKLLVTIPPGVVHGVQNRGDETATFINMPTNAYDPTRPDKSRVGRDHPGIPYRFE